MNCTICLNVAMKHLSYLIIMSRKIITLWYRKSTIEFCHNDSKIIFHATARHSHFLSETTPTSCLKLHPLPDRTNPNYLLQALCVMIRLTILLKLYLCIIGGGQRLIIYVWHRHWHETFHLSVRVR